MHAVTHLCYLGKHDRCTCIYQHICRIACRRISTYSGKCIASSALHSDTQIRKRKRLSLSLVQDLKLFLSHIHDCFYHGVKAFLLLQNHYIFRGNICLIQKHFHSQFFTAECYHHHLSTKIRVFDKISQRTDRHFCFGRIDRNSASIRMIDWHDIVYVWIFWKKLFLHTLHCHIQYARYTLHSCADSQNISGSGITSVRISVSFKCRYRWCRKIFHDLHPIFHIINRRRCRKFQHKFVDPVSFFNVVHRISENHAIADDRFSLRDLFQCDLMCLRDILICNKVFCHLCSRLDFLHRDCYVICFVYFYK